MHSNKIKFAGAVCAGIVSFYSYALFAAIPARFVEYVTFTPKNDGTYATFLSPETGTTYPDTQQMRYHFDVRLNETLPTETAYFCGWRTGTTTRNRLMWLACSDGEYTVETSAGSSLPVTPGRRYVIDEARTPQDGNTGASYMRLQVYDVEGDSAKAMISSSTRSARSSAYDKLPALLFNSGYKAANQGTLYKYSVPMDIYGASITYFSDGSETVDFYPCVDADGNAGLYDRVSGEIRYCKYQTQTANWTTNGGTKDYSMLTAPSGVADSSRARVNNGVVEFAVTATADTGAQISLDGVTWTSEPITVWTAAGGADVTLYCRADPSAGDIVKFWGWRPEHAASDDFITGVSGVDTGVATIPAGRAYRILAKADMNGLPAQLIEDGDFEDCYSACWAGLNNRKPASDATYVNAETSKEGLGEYVWYFAKSASNRAVYQYVYLVPGSYTLSDQMCMVANATTGYRGAWTNAVECGESLVLNTAYPNYSNYVTPINGGGSFTVDTAGLYKVLIGRRPTSKTPSVNGWVDNVSLTLDFPFPGIVVQGDPDNYKTSDGLPYYGMYPLQDGQTGTFTAPSGTVSVEGGTMEAAIAGYRVDTYDPDAGEWVSGSLQSGNSFMYIQNGTETKRLVWVWSAGFTVGAQSAVAGIKVSTDGVTWQDSLEMDVSGGDEVTFYAGPDSTRYYFWSGCQEGTVYGENNASVTFVAAAAVTPTVADVAPNGANVWTGAADDGAFETAGNWSLGVVPGEGGDVCIPKGSTVTVAGAITVGNLWVGAHGVSQEPTTVTFCNGFDVNTVAGDLVVGAGATISHELNTDSSEVFKLNLAVGGDMTIESDGSVDVSNCGFGANRGPGQAVKVSGQQYCGASYGSMGYVQGGIENTQQCYGSALFPFSLGSGGYAGETLNAGGAAKITVTGDLVVNGGIYAECRQSAGSYPTGTGGSIWLTANKISGSGTISASVIENVRYPYSAAGRIALYQTGTEGWSDWAGTLKVVSSGGPGTVYMEDSTGAGTLKLNLHSPASGISAYPVQLPMADDGDARKVYANAAVTLGTKARLTLTGNMKVSDLSLVSSSASIDLNGYTLKVVSSEHKNGEGWTGGTYQERIDNGSIVLDGGQIVWSTPGFVITIR